MQAKQQWIVKTVAGVAGRNPTELNMRPIHICMPPDPRARRVRTCLFFPAATPWSPTCVPSTPGC